MNEPRIVMLQDVLKSSTPVLLQQMISFTKKPEQLFERLQWLKDIETTADNLPLKDIFIAERFIEILRDNNLDIGITRTHIRTE